MDADVESLVKVTRIQTFLMSVGLVTTAVFGILIPVLDFIVSVPAVCKLCDNMG